MLIKTKYIDCASKSVFNTWKLPTSAADTSGDIYWSAVVYIKDTGEVWTHGKLYGGFFSNADNNKVSLTIGGTTKILALDGHVQSYTTLTGSGSIADQAILSTGEANKWTLKTLGKNAFSNVDYLPADATAVAAEKVVHALAFQYNGKAIHSFDGSVARVLNIIQGDNVFITGDSQGNVTIAADPGIVNTAGATNKVDTKLFLIGAESQTTAPQTYSNQYVYIGTDNCLYSLGKKVLTEHQAIYNLDLQTQVGEAVTKVTTFDPNAANNSFTLVQGTNVTLTPDAANKKVTISSKDTTYDFYNLVFKQGESVIDTYKPTTSPSKTLKAGTNVTFTGSNNEVLITTQDTRNTAGATEKLTTKLFLTGALTQTDNPQTYTNSKVYIGADNKLYSDGKVVSTGDHTHNYAGATSPGGPALKVDLNPSGLLDATYGSYGGILQDSNKGPVSGSWSNRIKILHNNPTGYYTELAQNFTGTAGLWHRRNVAGTISEWTPVIDNANFHTYLDSTYVIRGNDPNVLTNYVRYSINTGLTMNWEWGNATPTHIWGAKASDSSKAYVFNGDNIRAFANAVNRAGDTMTGPLVIASTVNNQYNEGLRISLAANNWAGITFGSTGTSGAPSNGWFAARNPSNQFIISPGDSSSSTGLTLNKGGNLLWRNRNVLLKDEINFQVGGSKSAQMNWASWGTDNYGGAIQIREQGLVTNKQSAWGYSPALTFHWGNRYAKRFGMRSDGQFAVDDVPISLSTHTHNYVKDISNGTNTTFAYSKAGMNYADFTWLAGWNGYELRAVNKSLFAQASHTHDYIPRVRIQNPSNSSTRVGVVPFNVLGLKTGYPMTADPEFASGNGLVSLYNDAGNGATVIERISDSSAANTTGYVMRIRNTGAASPGLGGFHSSINSRANAVFVQIFRAKIPTGHSVVQASNSMGSSYGDVWITDTAGTGKWEWYGRIIYCGESGSFSSGGHVYLNGNAGTSSSPLYWYISYCQVYDLTKGRYDGLRCRYADEVTNADTVDGQHASAFSYKSWWHWSGQSGQPTWLWGGNSENSYYVYNPSNFNVNSATYAHKVRGEYTGNGGQQNPNYFGTNWVGFRMMNTTVGTDRQYKDWIISDCYSGNDVGGAVAFGMNRQSLGAYLMGSDSNRSSWTRKGTFWGDWNLDPVTKSQLKKTRVPGEVVDFYVYQVNGYTCTSTDYTTFRNQLFDSSGRGKSSVSYKATYSSMTYTVNLSDFVLAYNGISAYSNGMYTAGGGEIGSNRIGSTAGANSKTITGYEMPKHAHWFGRCRSDNANDRDVFGPDGGQNHSTNGTTSAGQGGNWRTGYSGNGQSKDWRPKTIFVFKMVYAPQSW